MTTSKPLHRYHGRTWCIDIMDKPWFIDLLTYILVAAWMAWTFATMQEHGPGPWLLGSAVVVLATGLFLIYNQRVAYLRIGDRFEFGSRELYENGGRRHEPEDEFGERNR